MLLLLLFLGLSAAFTQFTESFAKLEALNPPNVTFCDNFKSEVLSNLQKHPYYKIYDDSLFITDRIESVDCTDSLARVWFNMNDIIVEMGDVNTQLNFDSCLKSQQPRLQGVEFFDYDHENELVLYKGTEILSLYYDSYGSVHQQKSPYKTLMTITNATTPFGSTSFDRFSMSITDFLQRPIRTAIASGHWMLKTQYETIRLDYVVDEPACEIDFSNMKPRNFLYVYPEVKDDYEIVKSDLYCILAFNPDTKLNLDICKKLDADLKTNFCTMTAIDLRRGWFKDPNSQHFFLNYYFRTETYPFSEIYRFTNSSFIDKIPVSDEEMLGEYPTMTAPNALVSKVWNFNVMLPKWSNMKTWMNVVGDVSSTLSSAKSSYVNPWLLITAPFISGDAGHFCQILTSKAAARTIYSGDIEVLNSCGLTSTTLSADLGIMTLAIAERVTFETPFLEKARSWVPCPAASNTQKLASLYSNNDLDYDTIDLESLDHCLLRTVTQDNEVYTINCDGTKTLRACIGSRWYNGACKTYQMVNYEPHQKLATYYAKQISVKVIALTSSLTIVYIVICVLVMCLRPKNVSQGAKHKIMNDQIE